MMSPVYALYEQYISMNITTLSSNYGEGTAIEAWLPNSAGTPSANRLPGGIRVKYSAFPRVVENIAWPSRITFWLAFIFAFLMT